MKKSNVIITVILAAISIFLLWLWFFLGFNHVDSPLDLVISIIWWAIIIIGIVVVVKTESTRRQKIRTMYIADGSFYNSELGNYVLVPGASATAAIEDALAQLQYGFDKVDAPTKPGTNEPMEYAFVVRTTKFDAGGQQGSGAATTGATAGATGATAGGQTQSNPTWEGEVVSVATGAVSRFTNRAELAAIIG